MKISTVFFILILLFTFFKVNAIDFNSSNISETPIYFPSFSDSEAILIMDYADFKIKNKEEWQNKNGRNKTIEEISIVFTKYPANKGAWKINYDSLLRKRLKAIEEITESPLTNVVIKLVLQTNCKNEEEAKSMFHGAVIKLDEKLEPKFGDYTILSDIIRVKSIVKERKPFNDSVVFNALNRNAWKNMLVVVDWTASMYEFSSQVVLWNALNRINGKIKQMVFFNDGDGAFDMDKKLGMTGGIYFESPNSKTEVFLELMNSMMLKGGGGDAPENNIEAIIKGIDSVKNFQDLILVADNKGGIRDLELSSKVKRPVRIIVCGAKKGEPIHPDLLKLAIKTNGSIHTKEDDLYNFNNLKEGSLVKILGVNYKYSNQNIQLVENLKLYDFSKNRRKNEILSLHNLKPKK